MSAITDLPPELARLITQHLTSPDILAVILASHGCYDLFQPCILHRIVLNWNNAARFICRVDSNHRYGQDPDRDCNSCQKSRVLRQKPGAFKNPSIISLIRLLWHNDFKDTEELELSGTLQGTIRLENHDLPLRSDEVEWIIIDSGFLLTPILRARLNAGAELQETEAYATLLLMILLPHLRTLRLSRDFQELYPLPFLVLVDIAKHHSDPLRLQTLDLCRDDVLSFSTHHPPRYGRQTFEDDGADDTNYSLWNREPTTDPLAVFKIPSLKSFTAILYDDVASEIADRMQMPRGGGLTRLKLMASHMHEEGLCKLLSFTPELRELTYDFWYHAVVPDGYKKYGENFQGDLFFKAIEQVKSTIEVLVLRLNLYKGDEDMDGEAGYDAFENITNAVPSLADFPRLRHLHLPLAALFHADKAGPHTFDDRLPPQLRTLELNDDLSVFRNDRARSMPTGRNQEQDSLINALIEAIESYTSTSRKLPNISLYVSPDAWQWNTRGSVMGSPQHKQISALRTACASLGIELKTLENPERHEWNKDNCDDFYEWKYPPAIGDEGVELVPYKVRHDALGPGYEVLWDGHVFEKSHDGVLGSRRDDLMDSVPDDAIDRERLGTERLAHGTSRQG